MASAALPSNREAAYTYMIVSYKQDDDCEKFSGNDNIDDDTTIQRIHHPVQDNLASRAAPLSRQKGQHERFSLFLIVRQCSNGLWAQVDIPAPGK